MQTFDLEARGLRELNASRLHALKGQTNMSRWEVINPKGASCHCGRAGCPVEVIVKGSVGYYCAGMNDAGDVHIKAPPGPALART
jgi:glutamate synthase domain-containing protein 3